MQVGPESAGANPGPTSYRRGGPLTVTDCNVLLGKLQPDHFPHVFGLQGDEPLDVDAVRQKFEELAEKIAAATNEEKRTPEELATGFLRIAVENMANAIKQISVQRGYDVTQYTMNCFGGAGGQHACLVADVLGMESVLIHPFAGVLSAFGMGLADIRSMREHQFLKSISHTPEADKVLNGLAEEAQSELIQQGVKAELIRVVKTAHIRTAGSQQTLPVLFSSLEEMTQAFEAAHEQRFGFIPEDHDGLIIDLLTCEAIGETGESISVPSATSGSGDPVNCQIWVDGQSQAVNLYNRETLGIGTKVTGPAIIKEPTGTNMVEAGWQAEVVVGNNLLLKRIVPIEREYAVGTTVDPVMLEVFNNLFMSIAEQMGATLANTAHSVNIKERYDFSCAIFTPSGDLVANAPHVPVHLGSMSDSIRTTLASNKGKIVSGDVFMMNNPFNGGTHLPDVTVITPVFDEQGEEIIFVVASRGHHADIGGTTPGSSPPDSRHIDEEGVLIDNFKLVDAGALRDKETRELLGSGEYPCRNINQNMADLAAQIAANNTGVRELQKIVSQFGIDVVHAYMNHVQDNAEESVRNVLGLLKNGSFEYPLDKGLVIKVKVAIDNDNREAVIDFSGTSPQDALNYNAPKSIATAVVLYVFRTLVGTDIPMNEGCLKPLKIIVPEKTMINPEYPAAVISGNTEVSQAIAESLYGALGVLAGSQGTMNNFVYGNDQYQNYETICGGTGAGQGFNGTNAVHSHMTNTRMTDPEILEGRFPLTVEEFSIRKGSGGNGEFKGGEGIVRKIRFCEPMTVTVLSSNRKNQPYGLHGGEGGQSGENAVIRSSDGRVEILNGNDKVNMSLGDIFVLKSPGGGGFGKPTKKISPSALF